MVAEKALRWDQYCIASVQFESAPIAPCIVTCIDKVYVAAVPLDSIRAANAAMVVDGWKRIIWF